VQQLDSPVLADGFEWITARSLSDSGLLYCGYATGTDDVILAFIAKPLSFSLACCACPPCNYRLTLLYVGNKLEYSCVF
jgi:hypothetical protein